VLLNDVYYEAGEIEANAVGKPSWARPHNPVPAASRRRGPRRLVGQALIKLGRAISAEPQANGAWLRPSR
jgi:hypothetical protein